MQEDPFERFLGDLEYPLFIVTARVGHGGEPTGCLVGFATQCSISPPRMLVCISKVNHSFLIMSRATHLAVHVVDHDQRELAELFGGKTGDEINKFELCQWIAGPFDVPLVVAPRRRMLVRVIERHDLGDHLGILVSPLETIATASDQLSPSQIKDLVPGHPL